MTFERSIRRSPATALVRVLPLAMVAAAMALLPLLPLLLVLLSLAMLVPPLLIALMVWQTETCAAPSLAVPVAAPVAEPSLVA
jgi:hypothetical protein